jgi:recombination protein RecA
MVRKDTGLEPTIGKLSDKQDERFLESGVPEIDELLGGLPIGRITEFWGGEGVGKTHLTTKIMAHVSQNHKVLFVDTEFALNGQRAEGLGVNRANVDYLADSRLERVCELLLRSVGNYDLIILDSLAYLTPTTVENQEVGENAIGLFARLIKHWIVKFRPRLGISNTAVLVVNQYRAPFGNYVKPEAPGGKAWGHAVDVRLYLTSNQADKIMKGTERVGHWLKINVVKSKVSVPYKTTKVRIDY